MAQQQPSTNQKWHVQQRVQRTKPEAVGTVVEIDGRMKVQWDSGAVSYYTLSESRNLKPADD